MAFVWIQSPTRPGDDGKRYVTTEKAALLALSGWTPTTPPDGAPSPVPGDTPVTHDELAAALAGLGADGVPDATSTTKGKARLMAGTADDPLYPASRIFGQLADLQIPDNITRDSELASVVSAIVAGAPGALDTLDELAAAFGDDPNAIATITAALAVRLRVDAAQSLTSGQRQQGRDNLGLAAVAASGSYDDLSGKPSSTGAAPAEGLAGRVKPGIFRAGAVLTPLTLATPDGGGQITHPGVVFAPRGWNGFRYWMAATPYNGTDSTIENPCIYCSNDGDSWAAPAGLTNPIEPHPGGTNYNSDTHLAFGPNNTLYCFWRAAYGTQSHIRYKTSTDGVTWTATTTALTVDKTTTECASPAVIWDTTGWTVYYVDTTANPNQLKRIQAATVAGLGAATPTTCTLPVGSGRDIWHIDARRVGAQVVVLVQDCVSNSAGSGGALYLATSDDGVAFTVSPNPAIASRAVWHSVLYRSSIVPAVIDGRIAFELFYSGISSVGSIWKVGRTTLAQRDLLNEQVERAVALYAGAKGLAPYVVSDTFDRADGALGTAESGQAWTTWGGSPVVAGNQAGFSGASNNRAVVNSGVADHYCEVTMPTVTSQAYLIFRGIDSANFWRIGYNGGGLSVSRVVAGSATNPFATGIGSSYAAGDVLAVRAAGDKITILQNGYELATLTDAQHQTGTLVGISSNDATARFNNFWARALVGGV